MKESLLREGTDGSVTLKSSNPFDAPLINPNFLGTEFDVFTIMEAIRSAKRFVAAPAWEDYIIQPFGSLADTETDALLEAYVRSQTTSVFHPVGTAAMSAERARYGVVNPDLLMKGVAGLRIVDASIVVSDFYLKYHILAWP
jgi:choline dehydrogenase